MKIYEDIDLTKQIEDCISFGIVPVGETKELTIWLQNDDSPRVTGHLRNLTFLVHCLDPENETVIETEKVEVIDAPKETLPYAVAPITFSWIPNISLEAGLKAKLTITGQKIIG